MLIGLDLSNRLPLLRVLVEDFADWQVILLTHDRVWFELAREHADPSEERGAVRIQDCGGISSALFPKSPMRTNSTNRRNENPEFDRVAIVLRAPPIFEHLSDTQVPMWKIEEETKCPHLRLTGT